MMGEMDQKRIMKKLGSKITTLKKKEGLVTEELAKKIDVARSTLWCIETGKVDPKMSTVVKIAKFFGMSISELLDFNK